MEIRFNATGAKRKEMVKVISETLETKAEYQYMPTYAYKIGSFTVTRNGSLAFEDSENGELVERVLEALLNEGFECEPWERPALAEEQPAAAAESDAEEHGLTITLPLDGMDEAAFERLTRLVNSKAALIRKALGAARLDIHPEWDMGRMQFPWFDHTPTFEEIEAISAFMTALCRMAKESTRVTATEKDVESEKYAFRGFLLRLGFIGSDSKAIRKTLMKNLSGSAAFPNKAAADAFSAAQKAKRDAAKEATL